MTNALAAVRNGANTVDRRWRDLPLRTRLTTAAALSATLAILAVVAVAYIAVRHELRTQIDDQLHRQVKELEVQSELGPVGPQTDVHSRVGDIGGFVQVINADGEVQRAEGETVTLPVTVSDRRLAAQGTGAVMHDGRAGGLHVRVLTQPLGANYPGVAVQIALPLTDVDHQLHALSAFFALLAIGGFALTVFLSWGAVRRVTRPVRTLTEAAEQIAETRDLTLRIAAENDDELGRLAVAFNTMLDALERSLNAQRQLVTDASHELRTPLASLRTNVEVLNDVERLRPEQRRALLDGIVTQLDELTGLVADVVELARGEAPPSDHQEIAFDELVLHAVERSQRHWPSLTFRTTTAPVVVRGVAGRLDRAVANMLDNAGKFSPAAAAIDVELGSDGTLSVADRGPGVPDEALPHVFDRFYRADEARALPGSGLGLAIAKQVAEAHGGSITLTNRDGGGAVATLTLPPADGTEPAVAPEPEFRAAAPEASEREVPIPVEESLFR